MVPQGSTKVIQTALMLVALLIHSSHSQQGVIEDYQMMEVADPLQPVWDRLDQLPQGIVAPLKDELRAGLIRLENNLERKMRSIISGVNSRITTLANQAAGGSNPDQATFNRTLLSTLQGFYIQRVQVDRDEATTKIEEHVNAKVSELETRIKEYINEKFTSTSGLAGLQPSVETPTAGGQTTDNPGLLARLDTLVRSIQANNETLQAINVHAAKINEKLDDGDTCQTLVDKVHELMAGGVWGGASGGSSGASAGSSGGSSGGSSASAGSSGGSSAGSSSSSSSSSSGTCSLNMENMIELRSALDRLRETPAFLPRDCSDHHWQRPEAPSGVYTTYPNMEHKFSHTVYCDMGDAVAKETGGWTVILRRQNSSYGLVDFNRTWTDYSNGFGTAGEGEWWYGLSSLHALTYRQPYEVQIYMHDIEKGYFSARYTTFRIEDEAQKFSLVIDGFSGNVSKDALALKHHGSPFTTYDRDNDSWEENNCAISNGGGWWYNRCHYTTMTAPYPQSADRSIRTIRWLTDDGWLVLDDITVMIRPNGYGLRFDTSTADD